jgi:RNA polymerase-interacting CarD/CdnL/TRCF family regulator
MFEHIARRQGMVNDLQQIERLQREIAPTAPSMLNHYLQRRSYTKALDFLNQELAAKDVNRPTMVSD